MEGAAGRTRVAIVGAGPAGLVLAALLDRAGVDAVVLEARSRAHVESRVRAGVLEPATVDVLASLGADDRLRREALVRDGFELRLDGRRHAVPVRELTGRSMTVYGQQEVVKDLVALRLARGAPLLFDAPVVGVEDLPGAPVVTYRRDGRLRTLRCEVVVACDGSHGVGRTAPPPGALTVHERREPWAWLGILAAVAPSSDVVVYATSPEGFALHSMRSPSLTRLYVQVPAAAALADWPDTRVWDALHRRLATDDGSALAEGPVLERAVAPVRSVVVEPMRHGNLVLAGDAAHIVPPTGAKGLNLAVRDVVVLAGALEAALLHGDPTALDAYSATCLRHVWWAQRFATWMTRLLHVPEEEEPYDAALRRAEQQRLVASRAALQALAEDHAGTTPLAGGVAAPPPVRSVAP